MILNLNKPAGWTSFDVVKKIRGITREKKVGHGGTLDPFATGVLIVATGSDTKKLNDISGTIKTYRACLSLGIQTDTLDLEGQVVKQAAVAELNEDTVQAVLAAFLGEQQQVPPMYSAKQVNGQRLYKLARKNIEVEREPVAINIYSIDLIDLEKKKLVFEVSCSKGTYIRVLGIDIAEKLGTVGHLVELTRLAVGDYKIEDAQAIEEFEQRWKSTAA